MFMPISSTNTSRFGSFFSATVTRQAALNHSSLSLAPTDLFSGVAKTLDRPTDSRVAHLHPYQLEEVLGPPPVTDRRADAKVFFEQPHPAFAELALLAGCFARGKRLSYFCKLHVAFYRGVAHPEGEGDLCLRLSASNSCNDFLSATRVNFLKYQEKR